MTTPGASVSHRPFDDSPESVHLGVLSAGSERAEIEPDELERAAARFVDFSADLLGIAGCDGLVKWVIESHDSRLGYGAEELVGQPYVDFVHPEDVERSAAAAKRLATGGAGSAEFEARIMARDGTYRWFSFSAVASRADGLVYSIGKDMTERKKAEVELLLARDLAIAIGESESLEDALGVVLRGVCERTGWELGQAWVKSDDGARLDCAKAWHATTTRVEPFRRLSEAFVFTPGIGLPGRVWAQGEAIWAADLSSSADARAPFAESVGLGAAVAAPVPAGEEVVAVVEFFALHAREPDGRLIGVVSALGAQLGSLVREERAEGALQVSQQHFGAVAQTAADAIVSMGADGTIMYFNEAAERAFGYAGSEVAGASVESVLPGVVEAAGGGPIEALAGSTVELTGPRKGRGELQLEAAL